MAKRSSTSASKHKGRPPGPDCRAAIIHGKETYLHRTVTEELVAAIRTAGHDPDVIRFDGAESSLGDVFEECEAFGLMAAYKVIVVDNAEQWVVGDNRPKVTDFVQERIPDTATLVMRSATWRPGNLDKLVAKIGFTHKCDELNENQARTAAVHYAKRYHDRELARDAADLLVRRVGVEMSRLSTEIDKLAPSVSDGGTITIDHVRELIGQSREEKAWVIQEQILRGDPEAAIEKIHELITISRQSTVPIRWAVTDLARKLHMAARLARQGTPPAAAMKQAKLWSPDFDAKRRMETIVRNTPPEQLAALFHECVEADHRGKTGQGDDVRALEILAIRFAAIG